VDGNQSEEIISALGKAINPSARFDTLHADCISRAELFTEGDYINKGVMRVK
jgi:hypothetical protein